MKKKLLIILLVSLSLINIGCSQITMLRTEEIRAVESKVDSLTIKLEALKKQSERSEKIQSEMLRQIRADQKIGFSDIDRKVSALAGNVYETTERLSSIDKNTSDLNQIIKQQKISDSINSANVNSEIQAIFDIALGDFTAGRFEIARKGFSDIIKQYPSSLEAELSYYWTAEALYAENSFKPAVAAYKTYISNYPEGEKASVALFKLGLIFQKSKKSKSAKMIWDKLISKYPDSQPAKAAKKRLENLKL